MINDLDASLAAALRHLVGARWRVHQSLHLDLVMPWPGPCWLEVVLVVFQFDLFKVLLLDHRRVRIIDVTG